VASVRLGAGLHAPGEAKGGRLALRRLMGITVWFFFSPESSARTIWMLHSTLGDTFWVFSSSFESLLVSLICKAVG